MDFYRFVVTEFEIGLTRALDEDELYLSHTAHVDGTLVASDFMHLGSFSDGTHQTGDAGLASVVINDPNVKVDFVFQLVNAGNASSETVEAALLGTAEQLIRHRSRVLDGALGGVGHIGGHPGVWSLGVGAQRCREAMGLADHELRRPGRRGPPERSPVRHRQLGG